MGTAEDSGDPTLAVSPSGTDLFFLMRPIPRMLRDFLEFCGLMYWWLVAGMRRRSRGLDMNPAPEEGLNSLNMVRNTLQNGYLITTNSYA